MEVVALQFAAGDDCVATVRAFECGSGAIMLSFGWPFLQLSCMNVHAHAHVCASVPALPQHIHVVCECWSVAYQYSLEQV